MESPQPADTWSGLGQAPAKFKLGKVVITAGAINDIPQEESREALARHSQGDWGLLCPQDREENDKALETGQAQLMSTWKSQGGIAYWIITEWDRSVTTILLPGEY